MIAGRGRRAAVAVLVVSLATLALASFLGWQRGGGAAFGTSTATRPDDAVAPPVRDAGAPPATVPEKRDSLSPAVPVELRLPAAGIRMPVVPKGVRPDGQMALPASPATLGWYRFGPAPRETGSTVLAGHVDSDRFGIGPLAQLREVRPGRVVVVRLSDGSTIQYRTVSVRDIPKDSGGLASVFDRKGKARLRLVTCGGAYDPADGGYQDNVVLTAVPTVGTRAVRETGSDTRGS